MTSPSVFPPLQMKLFLTLALLSLSASAVPNYSEILTRLESLEKENARIKTELHRAQGLHGELRIFHADECPEGWVEFNRTQGYLMMPRPAGGRVGTQLNRAMEAGETARAPEHSHEVTVTDLGHTHVTAIEDPGHFHNHTHTFVMFGSGGDGSEGQGVGGGWASANTCKPNMNDATVNTTGISVDVAMAKSNIQASLSSNKRGEAYPLVYILVCRRSS